MARAFAGGKLVEFVLVGVGGIGKRIGTSNQEGWSGEIYEKGIGIWLGLVWETTKYWPDLFKNLYENSPTILWAILC